MRSPTSDEISTSGGHDDSADAAANARSSSMPDIAGSVPAAGVRLDRVGMGAIEMAVRIPGPDGRDHLVPAKANATVSLDDQQAKGIHMSRLFLALEERLATDRIAFGVLGELLENFVSSQRGLARDAELQVSFDLLTRRPALASDNEGWRHYPIRMGGTLIDGVLTFELGLTVTYSSTCPCSAALARQLIQERFRETFANREQLDLAEVEAWLGTEDGICATPHSQRSTAEVTVRFSTPDHAPEPEALIDAIESALGTPVQAAVKRVDEQAFARLNGSNLMFCEDAARRVRHVLDDIGNLTDFRAHISHRESLHPHDAIATVVKGVAGGLVP